MKFTLWPVKICIWLKYKNLCKYKNCTRFFLFFLEKIVSNFDFKAKFIEGNFVDRKVFPAATIIVKGNFSCLLRFEKAHHADVLCFFILLSYVDLDT